MDLIFLKLFSKYRMHRIYNIYTKISILIKSIFAHSQFDLLGPADILLIDRVFDRSYVLNGEAYSPILDTVKDVLEKEGYKVIKVTSPVFFANRKNSKVRAISIDREFARSLLKDKIIYRSNKKRYAFWRNLLEIVSPNYVIAIQPSYDLCAVGKALGIKVCDFQHGIIEPRVYYHVGFTGHYREDGLPDICFCWDEASASKLRNILPSVHAQVVGNPWIYKFKKNRPGDQIVFTEQGKLKKIADDNRKILITLQWVDARRHEIPISSLMIRAMDHLIHDGWSCWVRFHPVQIKIFGLEKLHTEWERSTGYDFCSNKMVDVSEHALPSVLLAVSIHFTAFSASAIDASLMGVPTVLWNKNEQIEIWFSDYIKSGIVCFAPNNVESLILLVEELISKRFDEIQCVNHCDEEQLLTFLKS